MTSPPDPHAPSVAILGATGTMGGLVLDALVARHTKVRLLVRRPLDQLPPGVEQVRADLADDESLRVGLTGIRAVLFISPHDADEEANARRLVRAAETSGTRIVFAGVHVPARNLLEWLQHQLTALLLPAYRGKLRIGRRVAASRTNPVMFIPTNFYQNDELFEADIRDGRFPMPMRRVNRVDVGDLAQLCAEALVDPSYPAIEQMIAGPDSFSGEECARIWSAALHRPVAYVGDDEALWRSIFARRLSGQKLLDLINTSEFLGKRVVDVPKAATETTKLLGRELRSYHDYVAERVLRPAPSAKDSPERTSR